MSAPDADGLSPEVRELLAAMAEDADPSAPGSGPGGSDILGRQHFLVEETSRDGTPARVPLGGVFLHQPTAALLRPSDFSALAHRRPDFASLRHVLVRFSFMLERLPPRRAYRSARLSITLDDPSAVVRLQRPDWVTTQVETTDSVTTEFSAALTGMVQLGADRTRMTGTRQQSARPVITAENRGQAGFGWYYQAQDGAPLWPRVEFTLAVVEMPAATRTVGGTLNVETTISEPRFGVLKSLRALPGQAPLPFRLDLG